ncbi:hypothetical protein Btru_041165 [Bulinus truncatus]|nr:hypothetical protein Btru_041165 [Bulinus truncatus]
MVLTVRLSPHHTKLNQVLFALSYQIPLAGTDGRVIRAFDGDDIILFTDRSCDPFRGACNFTCPSGRYGFNCSSYCSLRCMRRVCHSLTGMCVAGCNKGFSGEKCQRECSHNCIENACDMLTSVCTMGCASGYTGRHCLTECFNCAGNGSCMQFSSVCYGGCSEGFTGPTCTRGMKSLVSDPLAYMTVGLVSGAAIIIMIFISLYRLKVQEFGRSDRRMSRHLSNNTGE